MKVALILTGYMRNWKHHLPNIKKNIISKYNADVFISSYDHSQHSIGNEILNINVDEIISNYNPQKYLFRDRTKSNHFELIDGKLEKIGREWSKRTVAYWHTVYLSLNLIDLFDYDIIIRCRSDISFENFNIDSSKKIVIPAHKVHPGPCEPEESLIPHFAYGKPEFMEKYLNLYTKIKKLHTENHDISICEVILKSYVDKYIGIENVTLDYKVDWQTKDDLWASEVQKIISKNAPELLVKVPTTVKDELILDDNRDTLVLK